MDSFNQLTTGRMLLTWMDRIHSSTPITAFPSEQLAEAHLLLSKLALRTDNNFLVQHHLQRCKEFSVKTTPIVRPPPQQSLPGLSPNMLSMDQGQQFFNGPGNAHLLGQFSSSLGPSPGPFMGMQPPPPLHMKEHIEWDLLMHATKLVGYTFI